MKDKDSTLIEELKKLEKRLLEKERDLVATQKKVRANVKQPQKKNKVLQDSLDHLVVPQVQVFG